MQFPAPARLTALFLTLLTLVAMAQTADAAVTITRTSSPVFYSDLGNGLSGTYVAYRITTDAPIADAWAQIGSFSGPTIGLGSAESGVYHLGSMGVGSKMAYFYLGTTAAGTGAESHTVSVYNGRPATGTRLGASSFSMTQQDTIQANSSKVTQVVTGPLPAATLGGVVTITVTGDTGSTGGNMAFTAATDANWPASTYKLFQSVINLPDGSTLTDAPYIQSYSGTTGTYIATYSFTAESTISGPSATNAAGYILSGQQMKHTQTGGSASAPPPPPVSTTSGNTTILKMLESSTSLPPVAGNSVTYTLRLENSGSNDVTVDDLVDTLPGSPAAASYVSGSATYNGSPFGDPVISGAQLTWSGSFTVPAGSARELTFRAAIPATAGVYTNSAIAHIGSVQIDTTALTTDNAPATASLTVAAAPVLSKSFTPATIGVNQQSTLSFRLSNNSATEGALNMGFTDTLPAGLTLVGSAVASQCNGTVGYPAGNVVSFSGGTLAPGTSCTITATVTGSTEGSFQNSYSAGNIGNLTGGVVATGASSTLQVVAPVLTLVFMPDTINTNQTSSVMFTIANPAAGNPPQSGFGFTDALPAGLAVAPSPAIASSCGGSVAPLSGGESSITFSAGALDGTSSSCTIMVPVKPTSATLTTYTNGPGNVTVSGGLKNSVNAQLTVVSTPTLQKAFSPEIIGPGMPSTVSFTINNLSSGVAQSNLSFSDVFSGIVVATPVSYSFANCTGGAIYRYGSGTAPLVGGEGGIQVVNVGVAARSSCTIYLNVTATKPETYQNNINNIVRPVGVIYSESGKTTLKVEGGTLAKGYDNPVLIAGASIPLNFTIGNGPDRPAQGGISFTDTLPAGLKLSGAPLAAQCGGTVSYGTSPGGADVITFSGGALAPGAASCTVTAPVTSGTPGKYANNYLNNLSALSAGLDATNASADLNVYLPASLMVSRWVSPANPAPGALVTYTVRFTNTGGPASNVSAVEQLSPYTSLILNAYGGGPFLFQDGSPQSGLAAGTPQYTSDGVNWSSTPPVGAPITGWKLPMTGIMSGVNDAVSPSPYFTITFQAVVK